MSMPVYANQPAKKKSKLPLIIGLVVAGVLLLCGFIGLAGMLGGSSDDNTGLDDGFGSKRGAVTLPSNGSNTTSDVAPAKKDYELKKSDIALKVKITKKTCYGYGLGCSVQWKIDASLKDLTAFRNAGDEYDVTYEVRGLKDAPETATLHMDPEGSFTQDEYTFGDIPSKNTKLTAVVTDVEKTGF